MRAAGSNVGIIYSYVGSVVNGVIKPGAAAADNCCTYSVRFKFDIHTVRSLRVESACSVPVAINFNICIGSIVIMNHGCIRADIGNSAAIAVYIISYGSIAACLGIKVSNFTVSIAAVKVNLSSKVAGCVTNVGAGCKTARSTDTAGIGSLCNRVVSIKAYITRFVISSTFIGVIFINRNSCICVSIRNCCITACCTITTNGQCVHIHAFADIGICSKSNILRRKGIGCADSYFSFEVVIFRTGINCGNTYCTCRKPTCTAVNNIRFKRGISLCVNIN